jgi:hypothetical protein
MMGKTISILFILLAVITAGAVAQISPGDLASVHSNLEGMSNCTQCHELGNKVTNAKCLACHTELKARIDAGKGYHSSAEIKGKSCTACHSDHHGKTFQIVRFNATTFNHALTGFTLTGAHMKKQCKDCHKAQFITNPGIKKKKFTYLGLNTTCLTCHTDYHQQTLSPTCTNCHGVDAFKPAVKFTHSQTRFPLAGKHQEVPCIKCHPVTQKTGVTFQQFAGVQFANCVNCHADVHQNKFGQNCRQCHSEISFHTIKGISNFDHSKTNFKLEDKHLVVPCSSCHKTNVTDPVKHNRCTDCHKDYHHGQFAQAGSVVDCSQCHSTKGFDQFSFTIEQHNLGAFKLDGAHLATPCFTCHKKQKDWSFRNIGTACKDCHENIHKDHLEIKYYPDTNCRVCHNTSQWNGVSFDHSRTGFALEGVHATKDCKACHFKTGIDGIPGQKFSELSPDCATCHTDTHHRQFDENGVTDCRKCHTFSQWKIDKFDHNITAFKLDGKHQDVPCFKCHKTVTDQQFTYVLYKIKEYKCENCH